MAQLVVDAVYGGVSQALVGGVVVPELGCTAVAPWRTFGVAREWRGYIEARDDGVLGGKNRLELVSILWGDCGRVSLAAVVWLCCLRMDLRVGRA